MTAPLTAAEFAAIRDRDAGEIDMGEWSSAHDDRRALLSHIDHLLAQREWRPIETAPKDGSHLILSYLNALGRRRTVIGFWTETMEWCEDDPNDYDSDSEFSPPDWYENTWTGEYTHQLEGEPTHYMPLPEPPKERS